MKLNKIFLACLALAIASPVYALTLAEKKKVESWKADIAKGEEYTKEKCGVALPMTYTEDMVTPFVADDRDPVSYCENVRSQVAYMCDDAISKEAIVSKVKKVHCRLGKKGELTFAMKGTTLDVAMNVDASNISEKTKEFLENNL